MLYQLRTYTLRTAEALDAYANVHWPRHVPSLRRFGVTTHGVWTEPDSPSHRLFALVSYPDGADQAEVVRAFLASPEQAADMEGFDLANLVGVEELLLVPSFGTTPELTPEK